MNQFVIAHESRTPIRSTRLADQLGQEIRSWPINLSRQGDWSNVYSDVLVNTHIFKGA